MHHLQYQIVPESFNRALLLNKFNPKNPEFRLFHNRITRGLKSFLWSCFIVMPRHVLSPVISRATQFCRSNLKKMPKIVLMKKSSRKRPNNEKLPKPHTDCLFLNLLVHGRECSLLNTMFPESFLKYRKDQNFALKKCRKLPLSKFYFKCGFSSQC